jgi:hypothetical protein
VTAKLIYLVTISAYDPSVPGVITLRYSSGLGLMSGPSESPANTWFAPRLLQPISFKRTMFGEGRISGPSTVGTGDIVLNNANGALNALRNYGIDGRSVVVQVGEQGAALSSFTTVLTGTAEQVEVGATRVTIRLRDKLAVLQKPLQETLYAGTNSLPSGAEGTADDIKGQRKPLLFGRRYHLEPVLVNTALHIYQFHDGAALAVGGVYDEGNALTFSADYANLATLEAAVVPGDHYATCLALGLIKSHARPIGKFTVSAQGDASGSGYSAYPGEIAKRLLLRAGVSIGDIDAFSFAALPSYECGLYVTGGTTAQQALDTLLAGLDGWVAPDRTGVWQAGQLVAPSSSGGGFIDSDILKFDVLATREPGGGLPTWRVKLRGVPYAEFSAADITGVVSDADRAALLQPWREVVASDSSVQTKHLLAPELMRDTSIQSLTDLQTEADRQLALRSVRRDFLQLRIGFSPDRAEVELNNDREVYSELLDYAVGRSFKVVGVDTDGLRNRITLDLWG